MDFGIFPDVGGRLRCMEKSKNLQKVPLVGCGNVWLIFTHLSQGSPWPLALCDVNIFWAFFLLHFFEMFWIRGVDWTILNHIQIFFVAELFKHTKSYSFSNRSVYKIKTDSFWRWSQISNISNQRIEREPVDAKEAIVHNIYSYK